MPEVYRFGDAVLDTRAARLSRAGEELPLEPRTFDVLRYLVERPGRLVPHHELIDNIWRDAHVTAHSLTQAISQIRRALNDDPRQPQFIETVHRRGYQFVAEVIGDAAPADSPVATRWTLPPRVTQLIGREELIERTAAEVMRSSLVTLVGPGGVGKTQLALEVGRRLAGHFADGVLFIDLTAEQDATGVARALARAMRIDPGEVRSPQETAAAALRGRSALLLFDNCERVVEPVKTLALAIHATAPGLHILATTQRHLRAPGQRVVKVPPLELPPAAWSPAEDNTTWPSSVRLFVERAQSVNPDFAVTAANAGAVAEICRRLDGVPLAVELAAARTTVLSVEQIAARLHERFELFDARHPAALARHASLLATISWSVSLLSADAKRALEQLSVFSDGWNLSAAEAVMDRDASGVLDSLSSLVDKSLVAVDIGRPDARYRLLDSIRLYARGRLLDSADYDSIRERHLSYFRQFSDEVEQMINAEPRTWLRRVREEHANLRDALTWALTAPGAAEDGLRLCCNLRWAWRLEGNYVESREWLQQALASAPHAPAALRGKAWIVLGLIHQHRGEFDAARQALSTGLAILPAEERRERAFAILLGAYNELIAGSPESSEAMASAIAPEIEALDDARLSGFALIRQAMAAGIAERPREAVPLLESATARLRHGDDPFLLTFARIQLGLQRYLAGDPREARLAALESLRDGVGLDNLRAIAGSIEICAYLYLQEHDAGTAARLLGAAARLREITAAPLFPNFAPAHARATNAVSAILGAAAAEAQMRSGANTPLPDLIASVLPHA